MGTFASVPLALVIEWKEGHETRLAGRNAKEKLGLSEEQKQLSFK